MDIERNVFPIINKCLDGILKAADVINEKEVSSVYLLILLILLLLIIILFLDILLFQDTMLVIERYKSGFEPPEDFPFEDLSKGGSDSGSANNINNIQISNKLRDGSYTVKGTITGKVMKKRVGIFHIFGSKGVRIFYYYIFIVS